MTTITLPPPSVTARRSLPAEWRALRGVIRRQWTIFRRYPSWIVALIIWPIIFPAAYILSSRALAGPDGSGLRIFQQAAGTADAVGYIAIGTTIWMWQNIVLWNVGYTLREEQLRGTLEANWLSPTWRFAFLLGSSVAQFVSMLMFLGISALEFGLIFGVRFNGDPLLMVLVLIGAVPSIYGLGFAFASVVITAKEANAFVFLVRGVVMVFCGITFPLAVLPGWMQTVAAWLPATYIIRAARHAALGGADFNALLPDLIAMLIFGAAWLVIGYVAFSWMERRARQTGAIGQY